MSSSVFEEQNQYSETYQAQNSVGSNFGLQINQIKTSNHILKQKNFSLHDPNSLNKVTDKFKNQFDTNHKKNFDISPA